MTNNDTITLDYKGQSIRAGVSHGRPCFAAVDVCRILGIRLPGGSAMMATPMRHLSAAQRDNILMPTHRGRRLVIVVTEAGLKALCGAPQATGGHSLCKWADTVALPAVRRAAADCTTPRLAPEDLALMREASVLIERLGARLGGGTLATI